MILNYALIVFFHSRILEAGVRPLGAALPCFASRLEDRLSALECLLIG